MIERIGAVPIDCRDAWGRDPVSNHCHNCGGQYDLRRIRMAYPQINRAGEETMYAGYCGECRTKDRLTGQLIRGEISKVDFEERWEAYCHKASGR